MYPFPIMKYSAKNAIWKGALEERWSQSDVDTWLVQRGLHLDDLVEVRRLDDLSSRIFRAAEAFNDCGIHDFSEAELAMLVTPSWGGAKDYAKVNYFMKRNYSGEAETLKGKGIDASNIHIFRCRTGHYSGNLHEAIGVWNFEASRVDLKNSVRLPLEIGERQSELLGVYYADAIINKTNIFFTISPRHIPTYYSWVNHLFQEQHNLTITLRPPYYEGSRIHYKGTMGSLAIKTWLIRNFGFPEFKSKQALRVPEIVYRDEKIVKGFLRSLIRLREVILGVAC